MGTRGGVSSNKVKECVFGLGLRMQPKESCIVMSHQNEPSPSSSTSSLSAAFDGGGGGGGPLPYSRNNRAGRFGDIYDVVGSGSTSTGEIAQSVNMRVPFTVAQWQELERQNIICRYLMASVPVPPELLIPILRTRSNSSNVSKGSSFELGFSSSNSDPEPWRCKRTDGKKWRCSRNVAPDQRYCERHSHKSRPRSRKPVELHSESTNLFTQKSQFRSQTAPNFSIFSSSTLASVPSLYDQQPRNLEWFLKGETMPVTFGNSNANQEWHPTKAETTKCDNKMYSFESNSYLLGSSGGIHSLNDNCSILSSPKSVSLSSQTQAQETRHFLDVWSSAFRDNSNVGVIGDDQTLQPSSLSLSMAGNRDEETEISRPASQWMSHGSWSGSTPGGPLAEALCLGISTSAKDGSHSFGNTSGIDNKT